MPYELKQCSGADREWAYALKSEAYREVVERQFGPWDEKFQRSLSDTRWNPGISQKIIVDGAPVGLLATERRAGEIWIDEIQLVHAWHSQGLGATVLRAVLAEAKDDGKRVRLRVLKQNTRARDLYVRLGFRVVGEMETHYLMELGAGGNEAQPVRPDNAG